MAALSTNSSVQQKSLPAKPQTSAPSGIALLRVQSQDGNARPPASLHFDDLIAPNSASSPAGISRSSSFDPIKAPHAQTPVIAVRKPEDPQDDPLHPSRASAPSVPPVKGQDQSEFGYVQRRLRKTSVDERMVCHLIITARSTSSNQCTGSQTSGRTLASSTRDEQHTSPRPKYRGCVARVYPRPYNSHFYCSTRSWLLESIQPQYVQPRS